MQPLEADDPRTIGEYRLLRRIGSGGMGRVYLGRSPGGRTVAVKAVHPHFAEDEEFRVRFRREVESARRVGGGSPRDGARGEAWTAPVLDAGPDARVPWVATAYVAGPPLQQAVAEHGPLPEATVRALGAGLAEALAAVHGLGLVHRDVKPSNVLLTLDGPRLIDFGIARATDGTSALTSTGVSVGSPGYMPPEQVLGRGGVGPPADVFSLGAVLAFAAAGTAAFRGDSAAALLYHVVHEEPDLGGLSDPALRELIAACLAKEPSARPTPDAVAGMLAGNAGAAALTRTGWLPGPLIEQVSRSAVALLDMEPEARAAVSAREGGPVPDSGGGTGADSGLVSFTDVSPGTSPSAEGTGRGPEPPDPSSTAPMPADPAPVAAVAADAGGAPRGRRRVGCTLVLSVAGVLCAALLSAGIVLDLFPGGGHDQNAGDTATPPSAGTPEPSDGPDAGAEPSSVPEPFIGTWRGRLTTDGGLPAGTLTVTVAAGAVGEQVATGRIEATGTSCRVEWELEDATERKLEVRASSAGEGAPCSGERSHDTFRLRDDGTLRFQSSDEAVGEPAGTLRKIG